MSETKPIKIDKSKCACGKCDKIIICYYFDVCVDDGPEKIIKIFKQHVKDYDLYY